MGLFEDALCGHLEIEIESHDTGNQQGQCRHPLPSYLKGVEASDNNHETKKNPEIPAVAVQEVSNIQALHCLAAGHWHDEVDFQDF